MLLIYVLVALYIAWIWVNYFRLIDIYDRDALKYFAASFAFGGASVLLVFALNRWFLDAYFFELNDQWINDLLYTTFKIGAVEELAKLSGFALFYALFRRQVNEPVDMIAYLSTAALGFSAVENVLYFSSYGPDIIDGRAVLSTVGHMFDTALIGYGLALNKFQFKGRRPLLLLPFFLYASIAHGIFDFTLMHRPFAEGGMWLLLVYFMITVELFATMLNNAINNSSFFSYRKVINPKKISRSLLLHYTVLFSVQSIALLINDSFVDALRNFGSVLTFTGLIVLITSLRMSRFRLIKGRWNPLRLSLPFTIGAGAPGQVFPFFSGLQIRINGESYDQSYLNQFYHSFLQLSPLKARGSTLKTPRKAYMAEKLFLEDDQTFYLLHVYDTPESDTFTPLLIKVKTHGKTHTEEGAPLVWILGVGSESRFVHHSSESSPLAFQEWGVVQPWLGENL